MQKIVKNIWIFFYSISIASGTYIAIESLVKYSDVKNFVGFSLVLFGIFVLEIYVTWQRNSLYSKISLDKKLLEYNLIHIAHKLILPMLLYFSLVGYGYFNYYLFRMKFVVGFSLVVTYILFLNIRAFFENNIKVEKSTDFVFDLIKFFIFGTLVDVIYNLSLNFNIFDSRVFFSLSIAALTLVLFELFIWRFSDRHFLTIYFSVGASVLITIFALAFVEFWDFNGFELSVMLTTLFYFAIATTYHWIKKDLKIYTIAEYLLIAVSLGAIFIGSR